MTVQNRTYMTWIILVTLTLVSASFADSAMESSKLISIFICLVTIIKGRLVIDYLMDLRFSKRRFRWMMLGYFYILMPLILFVILFPDSFKQFTTL